MPLKVSQQAPDFSLRDLEGKEHVLPGDLITKYPELTACR